MSRPLSRSLVSAPVALPVAMAAAATLIVSGAQAANAQTGTAQTGTGTAQTESQGSLALGSLSSPVDQNGNGSIDTSGSLIGEPTIGNAAASTEAALGSNVSRPAPGTGSVDTSKGSLGEPTTGSLAPLWAPLAGSLGVENGLTTTIGSSSIGSASSAQSGGSGGSSGLVPLVLVGGSVVAGVALGTAAWPQVQAQLQQGAQALDAAIKNAHLPQLPPLCGCPQQR